MVRQLHDLTAELVDDGFDWNVVIRDRVPSGLIDCEQARPGQRVEDVAKLCWALAEPTPESDPLEVGARWGQLAGAYGLEPVDALRATALVQMQTCAEDIEREAATGSVRHQALAARGDHVALRAMHTWTATNERSLWRGISS
jgi:Ser/Thr protein kinase RdoA (MazF antagonist)